MTLEAKTTCSTVVKKAKTTIGCIIQEAKATCYKAISEVKAQRASQAESFQREHGNIMWDLEEQVIQEESRSQANFLSAWQLHTTSYWGKHLHCLHLPCHRGLWKNSPHLQSSTPSLKQSSRSKSWHPSPRSCGEYAFGQNHSKGDSWKTFQLQEVSGPSLVYNTQAEPC